MSEREREILPTNKPERFFTKSCAWCPKDARIGTTIRCRTCGRYYCPPDIRDCMAAHQCR